MIFPSPEFDQSIAALCHGTIGDEDLIELHELLRDDPAARDEYLWRVEVHSHLASASLGGRDIAETTPALPLDSTPPTHSFPPDRDRQTRRSRFATLALLAAFVLMAGLWLGPRLLNALAKPDLVAEVVSLQDARWMDTETQVVAGEGVHDKQRIELSSGSVTVQFRSGARLKLVGPAILVPRSENSASLVLGEAHLLAETAASKGFVLLTPTSKFVDISTAFTAVVAPDGLSRLEVIEGEVDVVLDRNEQATPRMRTGESLYIEPGERSVMTRIEPGDGTAAFDFPNIPPPSREDYADQRFGRATIRVLHGHLRSRPGPSASGPVSVLIDGAGQSKQDAPQESAFFEGPPHGSFLLDLGQTISIDRIHSYSWHQHRKIKEHRHRAQQRYTLYGFAGDEPPDLSRSPDESGWTRIARVNSDQFFRVSDALDRPPQQACAITAAQGEIGRFRYLLFDVQRETFFGEIDVFGSP